MFVQNHQKCKKMEYLFSTFSRKGNKGHGESFSIYCLKLLSIWKGLTTSPSIHQSLFRVSRPLKCMPFWSRYLMQRRGEGLPSISHLRSRLVMYSLETFFQWLQTFSKINHFFTQRVAPGPSGSHKFLSIYFWVP